MRVYFYFYKKENNEIEINDENSYHTFIQNLEKDKNLTIFLKGISEFKNDLDKLILKEKEKNDNLNLEIKNLELEIKKEKENYIQINLDKEKYINEKK